MGASKNRSDQVSTSWGGRVLSMWDATDAAMHEAQKVNNVLDLSNTGKKIWADEHVFGHQQSSMGGMRTICFARARFKIGMMNLDYDSSSGSRPA